MNFLLWYIKGIIVWIVKCHVCWGWLHIKLCLLPPELCSGPPFCECQGKFRVYRSVSAEEISAWCHLPGSITVFHFVIASRFPHLWAGGRIPSLLLLYACCPVLSPEWHSCLDSPFHRAFMLSALLVSSPYPQHLLFGRLLLFVDHPGINENIHP